MAAAMPTIRLVVHDRHPGDACALVDAGLGRSNDLAAPLHEVRPISCFARTPAGQAIGGAVGRWWGPCCELQQLWVEPSHRRRGLGAELVRAFEAHAQRRGCTSVYLESFSFQAPRLYRSLGYEVELERTGFPHGIVKYHMVKRFEADPDRV